MEFNDNGQQENNGYNNNCEENRKNYIDLIYDNNEQNYESDFKCYNPRSDSHGLVIVTSKKSDYNIKFDGNNATISIPEENFNMSTSLSSLQIVTNNRSNILYVKKEDSGEFRVITNNYIKLPYFKIANASKETSFIETIFNDNKLNLNAKNDEISFIHKSIPIVNDNVSAEEVNNIIEPVVDTEPIAQPISCPIVDSVSDNNETQEIVQDTIQESANSETNDTTQSEIQKVQENASEVVTEESNVETNAPLQQEEVHEETIDEVQSNDEQDAITEESTQLQDNLNESNDSSIFDTQIIQSVIENNDAAESTNLIESFVEQELIEPKEIKSEAKTVVKSTTKKSSKKSTKSTKTMKSDFTVIEDDDYEEPSLLEEETKATKKIKVTSDTFDIKNMTDNNNLIISESDKKVFLPYTVKDLNKKLKNNKNYKSVEDVINSEYIVPIDNYKNPAKSRFKEAFNLIKKKEHGSFREAMDLGFELVFQSNLHPAIISACKNLDELDIYLDCLDDNDVDSFNCFNITYDVPPIGNTKNSKRKKEQD